MFQAIDGRQAGKQGDVALVDDLYFRFIVTGARGQTFEDWSTAVFVIGIAPFSELMPIPEADHEAWFAARAKGG